MTQQLKRQTPIKLSEAWQLFLQRSDVAYLKQSLAHGFPPDRHWMSDWQSGTHPGTAYSKGGLGLVLDGSLASELEQRWQWLSQQMPQLMPFFQARQIDSLWIEPLWNVWLPLAEQLIHWRQKSPQAAVAIGILGSQGSGKTTLTQLLTLLLQARGYRVASLSLDDFYLTYNERLALQQTDPRLIRRGPPGTHDVRLGLRVLKGLKAGQKEVLVPRFDKSAHDGEGDRSGFEPVGPVDIVLLEGWFVGARPVAPYMFDVPPPPIITEADQEFAQDMNMDLYEYLPWWELLDRLIVLDVPDYQLSRQWRKQAEHQMVAQGKTGMSDRQMDEFVEYFWKALHPELFITPLTQEAGWSDLVIQLDATHCPDRVYRPGVEF
jgi:D-glycerate 3-kinase